MEFYSVVVKIPNDFAEEVPGLDDSFYTWISGVPRPIPEWSDLDGSQISWPRQILADKIVREFVKKWNWFTMDEKAPYFAQLEKGEDTFHVHILVSNQRIASFVAGRYFGQIKAHLIYRVYRDHTPLTEDWIQVQKTGSRGANAIKDEGFIPCYLLPKKQDELQWAWTNIDKYSRATLSLAERARLIREWRLEHRSLESDPEGESDPAPRKTNKSAAEYMALVKWLVDHGISSERAWMKEDSEGYLSYNATGSSRAQIKAALENACRIMINTKTAADYLIGKEMPADITKNKIYKLFELNGYEPNYAGSILLGWCRVGFGKRNTIWLFGPATTGKTNLAEAISHAVPFYGCVNWTNENFPFNDCVDKMIIWWEEGKMTSKVVESAKAVLGGSRVRVDQKCKSSQQIEPTPVIITSNTNMCEVIDGNSTTFEHRQPLEDRMFKFELMTRLPPTFGKITKTEVREFFAWAEANVVEVDFAFNVRKNMNFVLMGGAKRGKEAEPEDKSAEPPAKKPFLPELAAETDACLGAPTDESDLNFADRYVSKCSKHLGWSNMRFPCRACERMNIDVNICIPHGKLDCAVCFPAVDTMPMLVHEQLDDFPLCKSEFYVNIDDKNKEQ